MEADETALGQRKYHRGKRQRQDGPIGHQTAVEYDESVRCGALKAKAAKIVLLLTSARLRWSPIYLE